MGSIRGVGGERRVFLKKTGEEKKDERSSGRKEQKSFAGKTLRGALY